MKTSYCLLLILCLFCFTLSAYGTRVSINVPIDVDSIQDAIGAAVDGDVIIVAPGTYYENINFLGKAIVVASMYYATQDTSYISQTVIDGGQNGSVVTFNSQETINSVLSGFTITNGADTSQGGGIFCDDYASPTLDNLKVINNQAYNGGGLYFGMDSNVNLIKTLIRNNNSTGNGGGAYLYYCNLIMDEVEIDDNECQYGGGGISCSSSNLTMQNVNLTNNSTTYEYGYGGGLQNYWESEIIIDSCLIEGNYSNSGGGILCDEMASMSINHSIIRNNESVNSGGGINFSWGIGLTIENSEIVNNYSADEGGGVFFAGDNFDLINVLIADNYSEGSGGGIYLNGYTEMNLINSTVTGNEAAEEGGGVYCYYRSCDSKIINSLLWENSPQSIYMGGITSSYPHELVVAYSDFEGGLESIEYENIDNAVIDWQESNVDVSPQFVNAEEGNYQLQSSSPCIDAGTAYYEYEGIVLIDLNEDQYQGESPDIGAYEFIGIKYGDINNDNITDSYDASLLLMYVVGLDPLEDDPIPWVYWRLERADVDLNSEIDALDAALVLQYSVGLVELPSMGGIRAENANITISNDNDYIYINSDSKLISCEYSISNSLNLKLGNGEVTPENCLYQQNGDRMAVISAQGISGSIIRIPYSIIDELNDSSISFDLSGNGYHSQIEYSFESGTPAVSQIKSVYPNPFNPETTIDYVLAQPGSTSIEVYNIKGQQVATLLNKEQKAGEYSIKWDAGSQSSGVYFIRIKSGSFNQMKKAILLK